MPDDRSTQTGLPPEDGRQNAAPDVTPPAAGSAPQQEAAQPSASEAAPQQEAAAPDAAPQKPAYEYYDEPARQPLFGGKKAQPRAAHRAAGEAPAPFSAQPEDARARMPRFPDSSVYRSAPRMPQGAGGAPVAAGFWPRLFALLLDGIVCGALSLAGTALLRAMLGAGVDDALFFRMSGAEVFAVLLCTAYFVLTTKLLGATLGKRALRLRVVSSETLGAPSWWQVFFRETFGRFLSALLLIGYLMAVRGPRHAALHDRLADTLVVYR